MPNQTSEPPTKIKRESPTKGHKNRSHLKVRRVPNDPDMIPLRRAWDLLQHLPGYHSLSSTRLSIIVNKELPFQRINKRGDIWVHKPSIQEMIGKHKGDVPPTLLSEDQKIIKHFRESKKNNYITAVEAGLASTLAHAKHVYEEYLRAISDPVLLAIEANEAREAELAKPETRCKTCDRTELLAKEDDARIVHEVTSGRDMLDMTEESTLSEYQKFRCKECWYWRPHTPILEMSKRLLSSPASTPPSTLDQESSRAT
jgi:hypothetical protein